MRTTGPRWRSAYCSTLTTQKSASCATSGMPSPGHRLLMYYVVFYLNLQRPLVVFFHWATLAH